MAMKPAADDALRRLLAKLRFRHLQLLVALDEGGSLRAATGALNLTQPALSKALGEVEAAFGFALFTRSARGLAATERGTVVVRGARVLLAELAHMQAEAAGHPAFTQLRIGAPPFVAHSHLAPVIASLAGLDPRLMVRLREERVPALMQALLEGELDVLFSSFPRDWPAGAMAQLRQEKLFDAQFDVVAPPGHPLARARSVRWERLAQERWIMPAGFSMVRRLLEHVFLREGLKPPQPVIESTSPVTNLRLVAAGLGLSAVPRAVLQATPDAGVRRVRVQPPIEPGPVGLIYRDGPPNARIELLRTALGLAPR